MRIIAGTAKGKPLKAPQGKNTRPTLDKVKEALFGSIQFDIEGAVVLDLFAGSGSLGLEALSRGAQRAVLNDCDRQCAQLIRDNAQSAGLMDRCDIYCMDYRALLTRLASLHQQFDFAFLDPPYGQDAGVEAAVALFEKKLLKKDAFVILEHGAKETIQDNELFVVKRNRRYGSTALSYLTEANA